MDMNVRRLEPNEWQFFRELRIKAITESPTAFKFTPAQAVELPDSYWQHAVSDDRWFIGTVGGQVVAMGGIMPLKDDPSNYEIASVWVEPERRGTGAFDSFVDQLETYARDEMQLDIVYASIFTDNIRSERAFRREWTKNERKASAYQPDRNISRWQKNYLRQMQLMQIHILLR